MRVTNGLTASVNPVGPVTCVTELPMGSRSTNEAGGLKLADVSPATYSTCPLGRRAPGVSLPPMFPGVDASAAHVLVAGFQIALLELPPICTMRPSGIERVGPSSDPLLV